MQPNQRKKPWPNPSKALPKSEQKRLRQLVAFEKNAFAKGFQTIAGVDEAGRGPLAGPVVAAACVVERGVYFPSINDSKLLSPKLRASLYQEILEHTSVHTAYAVVDASVIDTINILQATLKAMGEAVAKLPVTPDFLLVDGVQLKAPFPAEKIIKGDQRSQSIAAASVVAKEVRDGIMRAYDQRYPEYGFAQHKGYGTAQHRKALAEYGPCPIHRRSFTWKK